MRQKIRSGEWNVFMTFDDEAGRWQLGVANIAGGSWVPMEEQACPAAWCARVNQTDPDVACVLPNGTLEFLDCNDPPSNVELCKLAGQQVADFCSPGSTYPACQPQTPPQTGECAPDTSYDPSTDLTCFCQVTAPDDPRCKTQSQPSPTRACRMLSGPALTQAQAVFGEGAQVAVCDPLPGEDEADAPITTCPMDAAAIAAEGGDLCALAGYRPGEQQPGTQTCTQLAGPALAAARRDHGSPTGNFAQCPNGSIVSCDAGLPGITCAPAGTPVPGDGTTALAATGDGAPPVLTPGAGDDPISAPQLGSSRRRRNQLGGFNAGDPANADFDGSGRRGTLQLAAHNLPADGADSSDMARVVQQAAILDDQQRTEVRRGQLPLAPPRSLHHHGGVYDELALDTTSMEDCTRGLMPRWARDATHALDTLYECIGRVEMLR